MVSECDQEGQYQTGFGESMEMAFGPGDTRAKWRRRKCEGAIKGWWMGVKMVLHRGLPHLIFGSPLVNLPPPFWVLSRLWSLPMPKTGPDASGKRSKVSYSILDHRRKRPILADFPVERCANWRNGTGGGMFSAWLDARDRLRGCAPGSVARRPAADDGRRKTVQVWRFSWHHTKCQQFVHSVVNIVNQ